VVAGVALGVVVIAGLLLLVSRLGSPGQVETVTVANGTPYNVEVSVGKPGSDRQVGLGTARRESRSVFEGVIDQGKQWVVHFSYGGSAAGEVTLDGDALRTAKFVIDVPAAVADRLAALGFAPSSPSE
jgi:hypothetical protein